jgi:hypothetical protein
MYQNKSLLDTPFMNTNQIIVDAHDRVGESPIWDVRAQCLWWVDIEGPLVRCSAQGASGAPAALRSWRLPERVGCIALTATQGQLIAAMESGIARITLADDFYLYDTPGVLWPRIIVEQSGYNLAASGAIGVNAFDEEVVALELLNYLIPRYPQAITERYKVQDVASHTDETLLEAIARYRGAIQSGGRVNTTKAAEIVIHDFRSAALGRLTLETPQEFAVWLAEGKKADAERAVRNPELF